MEFQEFTGDNVDLAINEAITRLQVPSSELEYEIINRESAGFLGFGKKPAKIRARRKSATKSAEPKRTQPPKSERQERRDKPPKKEFHGEQKDFHENKKEIREKPEVSNNREQKPLTEPNKVEEGKESRDFRETKTDFKKGRNKFKKGGEKRPRREQPYPDRREFKKELESTKPAAREKVQEVKAVVRTEEEIQTITDSAVTFLKGVFAAMRRCPSQKRKSGEK